MLKKIIVFIVITMTINVQCFAQDGDAGGGDASIVKDSLQDFSIVMGCGLGGVILGLSTLSFVDEPKEHLRSLWIGGSIGIILGVGIVAWMQANKSKEMYLEGAEGGDVGYIPTSSSFSTGQRLSWHSKRSSEFATAVVSRSDAPYFQYNFSF